MNVQETGQHSDVLIHKAADLPAMLGLGRSTVYKLLASGKLRSVRAGRRIVIPADAVTEFLKGRQ